jgi:hypothetical protein
LKRKLCGNDNKEVFCDRVFYHFAATGYQRKVADGKNPMRVLNAVRFKLICRIYSVVKRNEEYQKETGK